MNTIITQKTREISFAILRVAASIRRFELRKRIEVLAYNLLENVSYRNPEMTVLTINGLRNFLVLAKQLYELEANNARIIDRELESLELEIDRISGSPERVDLESTFSRKIPVTQSEKERVVVSIPRKKKDVLPVAPPNEVIIDEAEIPNLREEKGVVNTATDNTAIKQSNDRDDNAAIRQSQIRQMIADSPEKRLPLKTFIAAFPKVSERTIRYDLQNLFLLGKVRRQGSGGPANFYELIEPNEGVINL